MRTVKHDPSHELKHFPLQTPEIFHHAFHVHGVSAYAPAFRQPKFQQTSDAAKITMHPGQMANGVVVGNRPNRCV